MKTLYVTLLALLCLSPAFGQDSSKVKSPAVADSAKVLAPLVYETFSGTRVLCNHSTEMLPKRQMEFIVAHKFGDILTRNAAGNIAPNITDWFGFDNLADVRIAFEYGITDNLNIGLGRSKGVGVTRQVVDAYGKYRIFQQRESGMPFSLAYVSSLILPYAKATTDSTSVSSYPRFIHRFTFTNQFLISRKFGERFSLQINAGYNHRNFVAYNDVNGVLFAGISSRLRVTKNIGVIVEYNHQFLRPEEVVHYNPLSFGIELLTGGHSFIIGYSNAQGLNENIFIPGTTSNWLDGQFRIGFSITRRFKV